MNWNKKHVKLIKLVALMLTIFVRQMEKPDNNYFFSYNREEIELVELGILQVTP